ncbi:MAG: BadF/BadG/BcrA/BcrD ATPase family protein [Kiritimatiellae bacterium]|nr:BadF/BadG/BcrA/BcrD ATPase family protein [Kiritimatiellia bacterium]
MTVSYKQLVLAVDAGGSKCEALLVRDDGHVLNWTRSERQPEAKSQTLLGHGRSRETLAAVIRHTLRGHVCDTLHVPLSACCTLKGITRLAGIRRVVREWVDEGPAALALAHADAGIVASAGTGAVTYGRSRDGREIELDGLGPMLGDYGSGYQIGHEALRVAARAGWHARRATVLAERIHRRLTGNGPDMRGCNLIPFGLARHDRTEIAALASLVIAAAEEGDRAARQILKQAATGLADTVWDTAAFLGLQHTNLPFVGTGGIIVHSKLYWRYLVWNVRRRMPRLKHILLDRPLVAGMALCALRQLNKERYEDARAKLEGDLACRHAVIVRRKPPARLARGDTSREKQKKAKQ